HERQPERVDRDRPVTQVKTSVGVALRHQVVRQVAVLDDAGASSDASDDADLLLRDRLLDDLARHVGSMERVVAEELRVEDGQERIVDLEVEDVLDAACLEVPERAGSLERLEGAAVSVRAREDAALRLEEQPSAPI